MTRRIFVLFLLSGALLRADWDSTVNDTLKTGTTDGSQSDTQHAFDYVDAKNQDGWVINIGTAGGSYSWTSAANMAATLVHSVTVQGTGGLGNPTIITASGSISGQMLGLRVTVSKLTRLQYLDFRGAGKTFSSGMVAVDNTGSTTSIDSYCIQYCAFSDASLMLQILGPDRNSCGAAFGCIAANTFTMNGSQSGIYVNVGNSDNQWLGNMTWGTNQTVDIESNTFTQTGNTVEGNPAVDSRYDGARYLFRYNTMVNMSCVAHGADSAPTSTLQVEFLHNTISYVTNDGVDFVLYLRGGSARCWDNTVTLTNGATLNQIFKSAMDNNTHDGTGANTWTSTAGLNPVFQQLGHGALVGGSNGGEVLTPCAYWGNTTPVGVTVIGAPDNFPQYWNLNTQYWNDDPANHSAPYTEYTYPNPLRSGLGTVASGMSGTAILTGTATLK